jgi:L-fuculose-phosphate aldolase
MSDHSSPVSADESALRQGLVDVLRAMAARGLNRGTSGNASVRCGEDMLITPTGVLPEALTADSMVRVTPREFDADPGTRPAGAGLRPSSEWRMHFGILVRRPDISAVVHCHSRYATILACTGRSIPSIHYMVAVGGRADVPLAPYHPFGSAALADAVVTTLHGGYSCLMANHGQIAASTSLMRALSIAEEIEEQAAVYVGALTIGGPNILSSEQMDDVLQLFRNYGQRRHPTS